MAAIHDLLQQVSDPALRERLEAEIDRMTKQKKFGLVFEDHLPECTPLYDMPVTRGAKVALRGGNVSDIFTVLKIENGIASCVRKGEAELHEFPVGDLICVAEFGEPIYPYLKPLDSVCNAPDSDLWHTLIEADNYHALQLLEYLYAGKVDCIYIDPPYNTGARDWKYNNDYVDGTDSYRHSKWLSFMQKRLKIAKRLLNPKDSVLIVTIDEKEYLHLGCLLEEMFADADIQMISSVIAQKGVARAGAFYRVNEFIFFVRIGSAAVTPIALPNQWALGTKESAASKGIVWSQLRRSGTNDLRTDRPNLFYPIIFTEDGSRIIGAGEALPISEHPAAPLEYRDGYIYLWPIKESGVEGNWQISQAEVMSRQSKGYIKIGKIKENTIPISYLKRGSINKIEDGEVELIGYDERSGTVIVDASEYSREYVPGSQWNIEYHDATYHGSQMLNKIIGPKKFDFPKSVYAVRDTIRFFVADKPDALVVDFFAGSGTTLHAINLMNAEDGGHRRCIMVTNNEVSEAEAKSLTAHGYHPGDAEWIKLGIARYVTWPRTVNTIKGTDYKGSPLQGDYGNYHEEYVPAEDKKGYYKKAKNIPDYPDTPIIKMADGFKANTAFFQLSFLNKTMVALGRQFRELLPVLWMKAGAHGPCPSLTADELPDMLVLPENKFAVLLDESAFSDFLPLVQDVPEIQTVFLITDSSDGYLEMIAHLDGKETYQLYRDYLDNFRINIGR